MARSRLGADRDTLRADKFQSITYRRPVFQNMTFIDMN